MPERQRRPDLDEKLSLDMEPEDALRRSLNAEEVPLGDGNTSEGDDS